MQSPPAGAPIHFPGPPAIWGAPWDATHLPPQQWATGGAGWATMPPDAHPPPTAPPPLAHSGSGPRAVFFTEGELTLDSGSGSPSKGADRWSPGSVTGGGRPSPPRYAAAQQHPAAPPAFHQQREQPSHSAGNARLERLEAQNYEMHRACQELQARLEAATAAAATPPPPPAASTHQLQPGGAAAEQADPQELRQLERRLAAKGREAAAAAQAAEAAQAALAARDAELEGERQRAAALADEVARWKDECVQVGGLFPAGAVSLSR